jgi:hypothetical protein
MVGVVGVVIAAVLVATAPAAVARHPAEGQSLASPACASRVTGSSPHYSSVVVIAFENHDYNQILGSSAPPSYFKTLAGECGSASDFTAAFFPYSLPNYLAATSGSTDGISGDCVPSPRCQTGSPNIFSQVGPFGWGARSQSTPAPCYKANSGEYVPRHVPAVYYTRIAHSTCLANASHLPLEPSTIHRRFVWVTANLLNDMHDGTEAQASAWLESFLAGPNGLLTSPIYRAGHMAIFIWFDSAGASGSITTPIPLIVVAPSVGHRVVTTHLTDYYLLHGWEGLLGETCLGNACLVSGFDRDFHL